MSAADFVDLGSLSAGMEPNNEFNTPPTVNVHRRKAIIRVKCNKCYFQRSLQPVCTHVCMISSVQTLK